MSQAPSDSQEHRLHLPGLFTIEGFSAGGIETCLRVPELGLMFDIGRCRDSSVARRFSTLLVSHGHADHLSGLSYLLATRAMFRLAPPKVHLPAEIVDPVTRIVDAWSEIHGNPIAVELHGVRPGDEVQLEGRRKATALRTHHRVPSLAYVVAQTKRQLKPEFRGVEGPELGRLRREGFEIEDQHDEDLLCVTGDTTIDTFDKEARLRGVRVLVHEVTAWDDQRSVEETRKWGHTHIDEMAPRVEAFEGEALVLVHSSRRHTRSEVEATLDKRLPAAERDKVHVFGV